MLTVMVVIHELGHYLAGRRLGFKVNEFAIGLGPKLFSRKMKSGTLFTFRLLPLGGFCSFEGDDEVMEDGKGKKKLDVEGQYDAPPEETEEEKEKREENKRNSFFNQPPYKRIIVFIAGALFNFISAIILLSIFFSVSGKIMPMAHYDGEINIESVAPAYMGGAGIHDGDIIVSVNGRNVHMLQLADFSRMLAAADGMVTVTVLRGYEEITAVRGGREVVVGTRGGERVTFDVERGHVYFTSHNLRLFGPNDRNITVNGNPLISNEELEGLSGEALTARMTALYNEVEALLEHGIVTLAFTRGQTTHTVFFDMDTSGEVPRYSIRIGDGEWRNGEHRFGFGIGLTAHRFGFFRSIGQATGFSFFTSGRILSAFGGLFTGNTSIREDVGGPITLISTMAEAVSYGFGTIVFIVALISVNLAIFNLLPLPALDGGRIVFAIIEWIRKKPINRNVEAMIHFVGLILLLGMAILFEVIR
jgi:regulator of sigma E protease